MKYIRTKEGKIFVADIYEPISTDKVADTIEELCDEFVFYDFYTDKHEYLIKIIRKKNGLFYKFLTAKKKTLFSFQSDRDIIYGAIWTDKGLIYVAKMNKDCKLCLL